MKKTFHNFTSALSHAEIIGSFLLPERLKEARAQHASGNIDSQQLRIIEDECVTGLVQQQKAAGLTVITDGEYRRSHWANDFFYGLEGIEKVTITEGHLYQPQEVMCDLALLSGKVRYNPRHPFFSHFEFVSRIAGDCRVKQTVPAPSQLFMTLKSHNGNILHYYGSDDDLIHDIVDAYVMTLNRFYELGCRHIQFDDNCWGRFCDPDSLDRLIVDGEDVTAVVGRLVDINNRVIDALPGDMFVACHICRGNHHTAWSPAGDYEFVAPALFAGLHVDRLLVEFDITLDNNFAPLRYVPAGTEVVLGLLASHYPQMESPQMLAESIAEASKYVDCDKLGISPRCGFHSDEALALTWQSQWDKIRLLLDVAGALWKEPVAVTV